MVRHTHAHNYIENPNLYILLQICTEDLTFVKWVEVETQRDLGTMQTTHIILAMSGTTKSCKEAA